MIETIILVPILWIVMSAIYMLLLKNFEGTKVVENNYGGTSMGDVQAGIEFIYHMREHLIDVGVATIYLFACYTLYLWLKRKFDGKR